MQILFEDNHIIAVNKQAGDLSQGDDTDDETLADEIKDYIKHKYNKPGEVFLGTVHRLDRPVSGAILYARTSKALERLNEMLRKNEIKKTYWAVTKNLPKKNEDTLIDYLKKFPEKNISKVVSEKTEGAKRAELSYKLIASQKNFHLLQINLKTGRPHQIRVQLSNIGCVIMGDVKYGDKTVLDDQSVLLHAREISFLHPVRKEMVTIVAPLPDQPIWNLFGH